MEISYTLTDADGLALAHYRFQHNAVLKRRILMQRLGLPTGLTLLALGLWLLERDAAILVIFLTIAIICFFGFPFYLDKRIRNAVSRRYRDATNGGVVPSEKLRATDAGLELKSNVGETKVKWEAIDDIA